ncbi:MAG: hypothetical protein ACKOW2_02000 [Sphingobacteriaceae bacterium]
MSNKLILIIKPNGEEVRRHVHGYDNPCTGETLYFYTDTSKPENTTNNYPVYHSGKCKGPIAFKKDGTLVLSEKFYATIKAQNGYLRDGRKNVHVECPSLQIRYEKAKIYDYYLIELIKKALDNSVSNSHMHSLEALKERYLELLPMWEDLQEFKSICVDVEKRPYTYSYLTLHNIYIGNSHEIDKLIEHFGFVDGVQHFYFRAQIKKLKEEAFSYNASAMGWV